MSGTVTIELEPDVERTLEGKARESGVTLAALSAEIISTYVRTLHDGVVARPRSLGEQLSAHIGVLDSGDDEEASHLSERTGERFTDLLHRRSGNGE